MKKKQIIFLAICIIQICAVSNKLFAQTTLPHIYKDWIVSGQTALQAEVSHRIIKCETINQIHLSINNKISDFQTVAMECKITNNADGLSFTKDIILVVAGNSVVKAECTNEEYLNNLKIDLPDAYDPNDITFTIKFRE